MLDIMLLHFLQCLGTRADDDYVIGVCENKPEHFLIDDLLLLSDIMKVKDGTDCMLNDIAEKQHTQEQQSENNEIQPRRITKDGFLGTGE